MCIVLSQIILESTSSSLVCPSLSYCALEWGVFVSVFSCLSIVSCVCLINCIAWDRLSLSQFYSGSDYLRRHFFFLKSVLVCFIVPLSQYFPVCPFSIFCLFYCGLGWIVSWNGLSLSQSVLFCLRLSKEAYPFLSLSLSYCALAVLVSVFSCLSHCIFCLS